jgi:delta 1-pyrroline-5-carboxylate dehydrogenase
MQPLHIEARQTERSSMNHPNDITAIGKHRAEVDATYAEARRLSGKVVVGGALAAAQATEMFAVENPADTEEIGFAPRCGSADVARAVTIAHEAWSKWARVPARTRADMLRSVADALEQEGFS